MFTFAAKHNIIAIVQLYILNYSSTQHTINIFIRFHLYHLIDKHSLPDRSRGTTAGNLENIRRSHTMKRKSYVSLYILSNAGKRRFAESS